MLKNRKIQRANSDIFRIISSSLRDKLGNISFTEVSVLGVDTSADFAIARVSVEISGDEATQRRVLADLDGVSGLLRTQIAQRLSLRQTPQIRFQMDRGRENANRVEELLNQINNQNGDK